MIEANLLERNAIRVDVNPENIKLSNSNLNFSSHSISKVFTRQGSARDLFFIKSNSIDMICMHPPYADIIKYSHGIEGDISYLHYSEFLSAMGDVTQESYRVLKTQSICAFMIADVREKIMFGL